MQMGWGYAAPLIIEAAVEHKLFDLLDASPKTAKQLATKSKASLRGVAAICNALVGLRLLERTGSQYKLTPESAAFLVSNKPGYRGAFFTHMSTQLIPNWLSLADIVRSGKPASSVNSEGAGSEFFAAFVESLFPLSYGAAQALGGHLGLSNSKEKVSVLYLGAGSGVWGIALAQMSPHVQINAVDWPVVLEVTKNVAQKHGVCRNN